MSKDNFISIDGQDFINLMTMIDNLKFEIENIEESLRKIAEKDAYSGQTV